MLEGWHEFYGLLGTAAAALAALLFVAASIGTGFMSTAASSPTRTFTSPVLFHYTYVLFVSLIALMPDVTDTPLAVIVGLSAAAALVYSLFILRRVLRSNVTDIDDHIGYGVSPPLGYAATLAAAIFLYAHSAVGPALLAGALIFSLLINIRNTWDLTIFFAQRRDSGSPQPPSNPPPLPPPQAGES
jgi:hypothetical protein